MNIKEKAKTMTRSEFMNWYEDEQMLECPKSFNINKATVDDIRCQKHNGNCIDCMKEAIKDIKFKDDLEGEKMGGKIKKVRCINDGGLEECLTIGETYKVREEKEWYFIINDKGEEDGYQKQLFEEVKEDVLMVECIDNKLKSDELSINKKYPAIKVKAKGYIIKNDYEEEQEYNSWRFKPVPKEKGLLEYAKDKENKCLNDNCNWNNKTGACSKEEEYNKLKKENEQLKNRNAILIQENHHYKELAENRGKYNEKLDKEADNYSVKITMLEQDNKEYKYANQGLAEESKDRLQTINKLKRLIDDNTENAILSNRIEDLEKEIDSYKGANNHLNKRISEYQDSILEKQTQIEELKEKSETSTKLLSNFRHLEVGSQEKLKEIIKNLVEYIGR